MIRVSKLTYRYPGADVAAARELDFEVAEGEIFGLLGPSGAGKSTTQNILVGLLRGWTGSVEVMNRPLADWGVDYFEEIGVSFELPNHFLKLTARENLEYFRALYRDATEESERVLDRVGLGDAIDVRAGEMSKGMKNRLTLARSLLNRPRLWFLDEPTAGLDPVNARNVRELIRSRRDEGATVFLTTHDMAVADDLCDRVGFIVDGELVQVDAPAALKQRYGRRSLQVRYAEGDAMESVEFPLDGLGENTEFARILREHRVESMHSQETTLEEVFIQVTGRALE